MNPPEPLMRATVVASLSGPEVLKVHEVPRPSPAAGQMIIQVARAGVNTWIWDGASSAGVVTHILGLKHPNSVSQYLRVNEDMPPPAIDLGRGRPRLWVRHAMTSRRRLVHGGDTVGVQANEGQS